MSDWMRKYLFGIGICVLIGIASNWLGQFFPTIGSAVFSLLIGMALMPVLRRFDRIDAGLTFTSKKILQYAVILLGFGLNLSLVWETGIQSLPIIISTISVALAIAFLGYQFFGIPRDLATLVGVGSSICGGSAIAATAPVIEAKEEDVAQAISVIFFFNLLAALVFPSLGQLFGFSTQSGTAFGLFAGTAINDTSSVTAAASSWDNLHHLGSQTLDTAVTVKLTRTLAIIPITIVLAVIEAKRKTDKNNDFSIVKTFPTFILFFILASLFTTLWNRMGLSNHVFVPLKNLSRFFISMAMASIGLRTNLVNLVRSGRRAILLGFLCWLGITMVSLILQSLLGLVGQ